MYVLSLVPAPAGGIMTLFSLKRCYEFANNKELRDKVNRHEMPASEKLAVAQLSDFDAPLSGVD